MFSEEQNCSHSFKSPYGLSLWSWGASSGCSWCMPWSCPSNIQLGPRR